MKDIRLDKLLTTCLGLTRSKAKLLIKNKKITVNGIVTKDVDIKISANDIVMCDGKILKYQENVYLMMNKPKDVICSTEDKLHKTVLNLLEGFNRNKLMIVGRLDIDTTGLLLITTDGAFVHNLTSPNKDIKKKYYVKCDNEFTDEDVKSFKEGIVINLDKEQYKCKSSTLEILDNKKEAYITISEGKYHQVKKMCGAVNKTVLKLKRVEIGLLKLDESLKEGEYRFLTNEEVEMFI